MLNIKDLKQQAKEIYRTYIGRNAGVEFIAFIVKFALFFALATIYIICLAKMGSGAVNLPFVLLFAVAIVAIYLFVVAPINLGRSFYFTNVAEKNQPEIDHMFHFFRDIKSAVYAYFRIAIAMIFYTVFFTALTIVFFKVYAIFNADWFSFINFFICSAILVFYVISIIITRIKYSLLPVVYNKFEHRHAIPFVAKTLRCAKGVKSELFLIYLSFIGWYVLGILSLGIGFIWINPYIRITTKIYLNEKIH